MANVIATGSNKKPLFGTISFVQNDIMHKKKHETDLALNNDSIVYIDEEEDTEVKQVSNASIICIDLENSDIECSLTEKKALSPDRRKREKNLLINANVYNISKKVKSPLVHTENILVSSELLVIEDSDTENDGQVDISGKNSFNEQHEPMGLLEPLFVIEEMEDGAEHGKERNWGYKCKYCERIFPKKDDLRKEYLKHAKERKELKKKDARKYNCSHCNKSFLNYINFKWHEEECIGKFQAKSLRSSKKRITRQSVIRITRKSEIRNKKR